MDKPSAAARAVATIHAASGDGVVVGVVQDDGTGKGVFVDVAFQNIRLEDCEFFVATLLRNYVLAVEEDPLPVCESCREGLSRLTDALAVLERDGAKPTGLTREARH